MSETIVLDPSAVATGRTEFDITGLIQAAGVDWGESQIESYMAEAFSGQVPVDYRVPNRMVTIPLVIKPTTGLTYDQARQKMQAKVGLFHREGGWLKRVVKGTPLYADVVNATLKLGGSGLQALRDFDIDATLSLECLPEFYGDEITLDDMTETTQAELVSVLKLSAATAVIKGDYPARTRIVVDEDQGQSQRGLLWGLRSRYYDSATTAALAYEAEAMTPLDAATVTQMNANEFAIPNTASPSPNATGTGNTTNASPTVTSVTNTSQWRNGMYISGGTYPAFTKIVSGAGTSTMTLSANATATTSGVALTGRMDAVKHPSLTTDWTPILSTTLWSGTAPLTHKGTYRVWARVYSPSGLSTWTTPTPARPRVRLVWDVGDLTVPATNDPVTIPSIGALVDIDLGSVRLDAAPVGTHRWFGMIQAAGATTGQVLYVDKVWFVPVDDGYGALRYTVPSGGQDLAAYAARDGFDQTAGALSGKTLPIGGTWSGAGDADDFSVTGSGAVQRVAVSDGGGSGDIRVGRWAIAGSTSYSSVYTQITNTSYPFAGPSWGTFARYVDINNWVCCRVVPHLNVSGSAPPFQTQINVISAVAGTLTGFNTYTSGSDPGTDSVPNTIRMYVEESGRLRVWFYPGGVVDTSTPIIDTQIADLAAGGALASGKVGFWELNTVATATARVYDGFLAWQPTPDAVMYASQSAQLRSDGIIREDSSGTSYGPMSAVVGDLPRLPPSGIENRTVELFLKGTRGDLDQLADTNIDDISAQVFYRPCFLFVPS